LRFLLVTLLADLGAGILDLLGHFPIHGRHLL
jgi:hypothetical protein